MWFFVLALLFTLTVAMPWLMLSNLPYILAVLFCVAVISAAARPQ